MQPIVDAMLADFSSDPRAELGRRPPKRDRDGHERDAQRSVRYLYELELDRDGDIIGGEWYTHRPPDFLWTAWRPLAWHTSASDRPAPLATIVEALLARART
jgi:hypothetical protein